MLDTAAMLVARQARELVVAELDGAAAECARLAGEHRSTPMAARTLLQQAVPTTFGYKAAGWLAGLLDARDALRRVELPAQLGGAAGTLAAFGERGPEVLALFAAELGLASRSSRGTRAARRSRSWPPRSRARPTPRGRSALDVVLLAQTEVGEVREAAGGGVVDDAAQAQPGQGGARACLRASGARAGRAARGRRARARARRGRVAGGMGRALGCAGADRWRARRRARVPSGLEVDTARMRANMSDELASEQRAFGIEGDYLGAAPAFVDRVLEAWRDTSEGREA